MKKKALIPTIALIAILGAVSLGVTPASAKDPVYANLVTKIAQRFNIPEAQVEEVVNQVRDERMSALNAKWEERLTQAVTDGKITADQKALIIAKHNEVRLKIDALKDLSPEDRKAKMKEIFAEVEKWATDNKVDHKQFGLYGHGMRGFGAGKKR